ncbi:hypothetical protein FRC08_001556 [Ceratobasidium sp. 394]|nr:hypothetical protein FRC08_001556 [Ceratobasidium sp. 394]
MVASVQFPSQLSERLPNHTRRYDDRDTAAPQAAVILNDPTGAKIANQDEATADVPTGWTKSINPAEGRVHFRNSALRLVTEVFIQLPWIFERLMHWYQTIAPFLESLEVEFDLYLDIEETRGGSMGHCSYYLVNYTQHSVFWLRDVSTSSIGLPDVRNPDHFKHLLEEQFWVHVEYMPRSDLDLRHTTNTLLASLATLAIDVSTSAGSVSPFALEECKSYSKELKQVVDTGSLANINWCTARIMSLLTQSRIVNLQGEPGARTDRSMVVNGQYPPRASRTFRLASLALFGSPSIYLGRWNGVWIDRVVYTREWRRIVKEMTEEWLLSAKMGGILAIADVGLIIAKPSTPAKLSVLLSALVALPNSAYSLILVMQYRKLGHHAADGAGFIQAHESSSTGLQDLALSCSIPGAMVIWSMVFLSFSLIWTLVLDVISAARVSFFLSFQHILVLGLLVGAYAYGRGSPSIERWRNRA